MSSSASTLPMLFPFFQPLVQLMTFRWIGGSPPLKDTDHRHDKSMVLQ
jgi:hypothetical protein